MTGFIRHAWLIVVQSLLQYGVSKEGQPIHLDETSVFCMDGNSLGYDIVLKCRYGKFKSEIKSPGWKEVQNRNPHSPEFIKLFYWGDLQENPISDDLANQTTKSLSALAKWQTYRINGMQMELIFPVLKNPPPQAGGQSHMVTGHITTEIHLKMILQPGFGVVTFKVNVTALQNISWELKIDSGPVVSTMCEVTNDTSKPCDFHVKENSLKSGKKNFLSASAEKPGISIRNTITMEYPSTDAGIFAMFMIVVSVIGGVILFGIAVLGIRRCYHKENERPRTNYGEPSQHMQSGGAYTMVHTNRCSGQENKCKLAIANAVLQQPIILDNLSKVDKSVIVSLSANIIPDSQKSCILSADDATAYQILITELKKSQDPEKLDKFCEKLRHVGQSIIADNIKFFVAKTYCTC